MKLGVNLGMVTILWSIKFKKNKRLGQNSNSVLFQSLIVIWPLDAIEFFCISQFGHDHRKTKCIIFSFRTQNKPFQMNTGWLIRTSWIIFFTIAFFISKAKFGYPILNNLKIKILERFICCMHLFQL